MEKTFIFTEFNGDRGSDGNLIPRQRAIKKSELTQSQKDLLLGEIIKLYQDVPDEIRVKFINKFNLTNL